MGTISIDINKKVITVVLDKPTDDELEAMREASKMLQREVLRYESDRNRRFNR